MKDTITESELTSALDATQKSMFIAETAARRFVANLGITVIPGPTPEPEGDVIVLDADGDAWRLSNGMWDCSHDHLSRKWDTLLEEFGPVKIYRAEKETK